MRTSLVIWLLLSGIVLVLSAAAEAACPTGTYPWVDSWGNRTCRSFSDNQDRTTQSGPTGCPNGSYPWVDSWGNRICQSFDSRSRYYDTSQRCPVGSFPWADQWGNRTCKFF
jgi:hypothetical protein